MSESKNTIKPSLKGGFFASVLQMMDDLVAFKPEDLMGQAYRIALLKAISKRSKDAIDKMDKTFRVVIAENGEAFESPRSKATGKRLAYGDVCFVQYDDKTTHHRALKSEVDSAAVSSFLRTKKIDPALVVRITTAVDLQALEALATAGKISSNELDDLTEVVASTSAGSFRVLTTGELDEILNG